MHHAKIMLSAATLLFLAGCSTYPSFSNSSWRLSQVTQAGASTPIKGEFTLLLAADGTASGKRLCNQWSGQYSADGKWIFIETAGATKKRCVEIDTLERRIERAYLTVLNSRLQRISADQLTTTDSEGLTWVFTRQ